jgi:RNA polymerase primary sigma factor
LEQKSSHQDTIRKLYNLYKEQGFLREEEALNLMSANGISLVGVSRITAKLVDMGVIFADESDDVDRAQTDYESIFKEALTISPGLRFFIDYTRVVRPPQAREWQMLMPQMKSGNVYAFNRLFDMYLRVVIKIALRFHNEGNIELDDAIQEGAMGLIRAIRQYDASKHGNFGSYAPLWVQQYINRAIADKGRTIRLPVHALESMKKEQQEKHTLAGVFKDTLSLDALLEDNSDFDVIDENGDVEETVEKYALREEIIAVLSQLTKKEQDILCLRCGLIGDRECTLEEIGEIYNVTRERIRQIESKALRKLRHPIRSDRLRVFW